MTAADLVRFAMRSLRGHRLRSLLSLLGVAIGIASVIVLTSLGQGARTYVVGEFASLGSNLLIVVPGKTETEAEAPMINEAPNDLTVEDAQTLARRARRIVRVAPISLGTAMAAYGERMREVTVIGTTAEMLEIRKLHVSAGRFLPGGDLDRGARVCVIGAKIQRELYGDENPLGTILRVGEERYRVIGVLGPRGMSIGIDLDNVVEIPVQSALSLFNRRGLFRIFAEVRSHEELAAAAKETVEILKERHGGVEDVTIIRQDSMLSAFGNILSVLTAALLAIAAISLAVAGIGIMNVMLVSVSERTGEIGLMKALGAERGQILGVFLAEASLLSSVGGVVGVGAGYSLTAAVRSLYPAFPAEPPVWAVLAALVVAASIGIAFGALPARRAARLDPVLALARRGR
jgi:putative ABC transport system permease protein